MFIPPVGRPAAQTSEALRSEIAARWSAGAHFDRVDLGTMPKVSDYREIPWSKDDCCLSKLIEQRPDGIAVALQVIPPGIHVKDELHLHPFEDRIVTVLWGAGTAFVTTAKGAIAAKELSPGHVIWLPRNTGHCLWGAERQPMVIHVVLNPRVPDDYPLRTVPVRAALQLRAEPWRLTTIGSWWSADVAELCRLLRESGVDPVERPLICWGDDIVAGEVPAPGESD